MQQWKGKIRSKLDLLCEWIRHLQLELRTIRTWRRHKSSEAPLKLVAGWLLLLIVRAAKRVG